MHNNALEEFHQRSKNRLEQLSQDRQQLRELILSVLQNDALLSLCAHYDAVDKLVLWNSEEEKMQLRLHIYSDDAVPQANSSQIDTADAHNHRWNFTTWILSGGYQHTLYALDGTTPMAIRHEGVGSCYTLHHGQFHSIVREPNTVSLIIRGALEKEDFQVIEGGSVHLAEKTLQRTMSRERYGALIEKLSALGIL